MQAFSSKNRSASVSIMWSADAGTQIIHGGCSSDVGPPCAHPESSSLEYDVTAPAAGDYYLTARQIRPLTHRVTLFPWHFW